MQLLHVHLDLQKGFGLRNPRLINTHISQQMTAAMWAVKGLDPGDAMFAFLTDMQQLSSVTASSMDHINISTMFTATAKVWVAAQSNLKFALVQQMAFRHVMALLASLLQMLQPMMPEMGAQAVSNILWSSAKLGLHLDSLAPGVTHGLMTSFLQLAAAQDTAKQPNAQETANLLWAVTTMKHTLPSHIIDKCCAHFVSLINSSKQPIAQATANLLWAVATMKHQLPSHVIDKCCAHFATLINSSKQPFAQELANVLWAVATMKHQLPSHVIDKCCAHFDTLINSSRVADRPDAQSVAVLIWAVATLKHVPRDIDFLSSCCARFSVLINSRAIAEQPNAQGTANVMWGLATSESVPTGAFLDLYCNHISSLIHSLVVADRPDEQNVANVLWALFKFKHVPSGHLAKAMVERMVALCRLPGQQPTAQAISNVILSCADLRLAVDSVSVETLVSVFMNLSRQKTVPQDYTNLAWSLAVLGLLRMETLNLLLRGLSDVTVQRDELLDGATNPFLASALTQMYQAWDWLQPLPAAPASEHQAWLQLGRKKLSILGGRPPATSVPHPGIPSVCAALARLNLRFKASPSVGSYPVVAILESRGTDVPMVLSLRRHSYLRNQPSR